VPLKRLVAHWFNVPNLHGPIKLASTTESGGRRWWLGHWTIEAHGWVDHSRRAGPIMDGSGEISTRSTYR
jgi:hypothetical protein